MASVKDMGNGKYRVFVCNGTKPNGTPKVVSKVIQAKSPKDAERQANAYEVDIKRGVIGSTDSTGVKTFKELTTKWRGDGINRLVDNCKEDWNSKLDKYILPELGNIKLDKMKPTHLDDFINGLRDGSIREGGYSEQTLLHYFTIVNVILNFGVKKKYITANPCEGASRPEVTDSKLVEFYDYDEMVVLFKHIDGEIQQFEKEPNIEGNCCNWKKKLNADEKYAVNRFEKYMYSLYVHLAFETGCRRNEMLALEWGDFDYKNNQISVYKGSHYNSKNGTFTQKHLKNKREKLRVLEMTEKQMKRVKDYKMIMDETRAVMGDKWIPSERLFIATVGGERSSAGGAMNPTTMSQWFTRKVKQYKLKKMSLHGLRHSCASFLLNKGHPLKVVADRLGDKVKTVENTYAHVYKKGAKSAAACFDE